MNLFTRAAGKHKNLNNQTSFSKVKSHETSSEKKHFSAILTKGIH